MDPTATTPATFDREEFDRLAAQWRYIITDMICRAGSGHLGGALSLVEIAISLYWRILRVDPRHPHWEDRDRLVARLTLEKVRQRIREYRGRARRRGSTCCGGSRTAWIGSTFF